jgi:type IV pilus assembly protein PilB
MKKRRLGEVLRDRGKISAEDLQKAINEQNGDLIHLGELMLKKGLVDRQDLAAAIEEVSRIPYADCSSVEVSPKALQLIPRAVAERFCVLPIRVERGWLVVAMSEPQNLIALDELRFRSGMDITVRFAFRSEVRQAIAKHYSGEEAESPFTEGVGEAYGISGTEIEFISTSSRERNQEAMVEMQADLRHRKTPAVRLVSDIIRTAMEKNASDIHIEPRAAETAVRIRVDGVLRELQSIPPNLQNSLISRIKILSDMDIAERRAPQDGRFMVSIGPRQIDLRVSTLPTQFGEKVVMRLLETSGPRTSFANLGMAPDLSEALMGLLSQPQGLILVTGPTGSGKSTTLYSILHKLRKPSVNIVTVEDPVEYVLPGINQSHVNIKAGLTFAGTLRSILRQDPNIIMVGEIRDRETAEIAMKAAQTGHLVLSTLHTNDSASAVVRLLDLGIPGFLISSSVSGILAQRLVRKLCSCHSVQPSSQEFQDRLSQTGATNLPATMAAPVGCNECDQTGYKGRIGIYEMLHFNESIRSVVRTDGRTEQIRDAARANGMRLMQEDALDRLEMGETTLDEILRVVPFEKVALADCLNCGHHVLPTYRFCPDCGTPGAAGPNTSRTPSKGAVDKRVLQS